MAMQGMHFMGEVPWKTLYLHGLVRAADGQKMSKSKGNVVDPLILMDQYGADALRFFMAAMESQGRDIKMDDKRVEGYRNFATKLWNAARFCQSNGIGASRSVAAPKAELAVNKWIIGEVVETLEKLNRAFDEYPFRWHGGCGVSLHLGHILRLVSGAGEACAYPPPQAGTGARAATAGSWTVPSATSDPTVGIGTLPMRGQIWTPTKPAKSPHGCSTRSSSCSTRSCPSSPKNYGMRWGMTRDGHLLIHAKWPEPEAAIDVDGQVRNRLADPPDQRNARCEERTRHCPGRETKRLCPRCVARNARADFGASGGTGPR